MDVQGHAVHEGAQFWGSVQGFPDSMKKMPTVGEWQAIIVNAETFLNELNFRFSNHHTEPRQTQHPIS
jgi:hypothetical protein